MQRSGSRPRRGAHRFATLGLAFALACQSSPPPKPPGGERESKFPSEAELSKLPPGPAAGKLGLPAVDEIDAWTLEGPFPERVEVAPHEPATVFERVLADGVAQRPGLAIASEAMHCTARELGRFLLARQKPPPATLLEFMAGRCGTIGTELRPAWFMGDVPSGSSDEAVLAHWRPQIEALVQGSLAGGSAVAGLWFGREGNRALVSIVATQRRILVTPFSPVAANDRVVISGELLVNALQLVAHVNQGALGYAECPIDASVQLPRFSVSCPIAAGDSLALIEIALREPGRILAIGALSVLARRADEPALTWRRSSLGAPQPVRTPEEFAQSLSAAVGRVRSGAELRPLGLSLKQSEQASALAPHVVAATLGAGSPALADIALLGLMAGWEVGGAIKDASLATAVIAGGLDANRWLEATLAHPSGRAALLDPDARVLAVGALVSEEPPIAGAVAVTYQLFGEEDFPADAERVFERIGKLRAAHGRTAPAQLAAARPAIEAVAGSLPTGHLEPRAALDQALSQATAAAGQPLRGWVLEASRLEDLRLPDELVELESVRLAVAVGYYQEANDPWGHYVALIVATAPGMDI